jgi:hypothetical protein
LSLELMTLAHRENAVTLACLIGCITASEFRKLLASLLDL